MGKIPALLELTFWKQEIVTMKNKKNIQSLDGMEKNKAGKRNWIFRGCHEGAILYGVVKKGSKNK